MTLLEQLIHMRENGPNDTSVGICMNLVPYPDLEDLVKSWPKFSGETVFPVSHPSGTNSTGYFNTPNKWVGEYGAARYELLDHLIQELSK